jgi:hypothetical protein
MAKSVAEAKQFCTTDLDDFDDEEDDFENLTNRHRSEVQMSVT